MVPLVAVFFLFVFLLKIWNHISFCSKGRGEGNYLHLKCSVSEFWETDLFFFFHPFFTPLHALLPAPKSVTLKKRRLKTSIKSSAETDCRGHSSIEKKSSKTRFFPWEKQKTNRSFRKECHNTNLSIGNSLKRTKTGLGRSKNSWLLSWEQGCIFSHGVRAYEGEPSILVFLGPFWMYLLYFVSDHIFQINLQKEMNTYIS